MRYKPSLVNKNGQTKSAKAIVKTVKQVLKVLVYAVIIFSV